MLWKIIIYKKHYLTNKRIRFFLLKKEYDLAEKSKMERKKKKKNEENVYSKLISYFYGARQNERQII